MPDRGLKSAPTLAVLITYFNEGQFLRECLESLIGQADGPEEILVYDDASSIRPDGFIPERAPVRIIRSDVNTGPGHGRNVLLRATRCDFVHCHDADDLFAPGWIAKVRSCLLTQEADLVVTEVQSVRDGELISPAVLSLQEALRRDPDLVRLCLRGVLLPASTTFRRDTAVSIGGYRTRKHLPQSEDYDFHARLALAVGDRYAIIVEPLSIQRLRPGSNSSDHRTVWTAAADAVRFLVADLPPRYRQDLSDAAARIASQLYQLGAWDEGHEAARLARSIARPRFPNRHPGFKVIAATFGQETAERIGRLYRK